MTYSLRAELNHAVLMSSLSGSHTRVIILEMSEVFKTFEGSPSKCRRCETSFDNLCRKITDVCGHVKCTRCLEFMKCQECVVVSGITDLWTPPASPLEDGEAETRFIDLCVECFSKFNRGSRRRLKDDCGHTRCFRCVRTGPYCRQCTQQYNFERYNQGRLVDGVVKLPCSATDPAYDDVEIGRGIEGLTLNEGEDVRKDRDERAEKINAKQKEGEDYMQRAIDLLQEFNPEGKDVQTLQNHVKEVNAMFHTGVFISSEAVKQMGDFNAELRRERDEMLKFCAEKKLKIPSAKKD